MQVTRKNDEPTKVTLVISADQHDLLPIKRHVLGHFTHHAKVPGFRKGTAPGALVEKHVDQRALADEFIEHALNQLYGQAIDQEKLRPAAKPEVHLKKFVPYTDLEFEVEMEIVGPIKLPDYKKIKLIKKTAKVAADDVAGVIKSLQQRMAERKEVQRAAKNGDELLINFAGKDKDAKPVAGAEGKDYPLLLGGGTFIPGFEDNLIGANAGDKKEFTVTFPKDYGTVSLRGKPVVFTVEIRKVSEANEPKVDNDFASKVGSFKTVAELKADIKKQLMIEKQQQIDREYENEIVKRIADGSKVEIPASLVDQQIMAAEEEEKRNLVYRGQTWQEHLDAEGLSEQQHRERQRPDVEARVKGSLILSEIAEKENIQVGPDELEVRIQILKGQYQDPQMQAELDKPENQRDIAARLITEKTIQKLVNYVANN